MNLSTIIKAFQSQYKLKEYFSVSDGVSLVFVEKNKGFLDLIQTIIDYHNKHDTDLTTYVPEYEGGYNIVESMYKSDAVFDYYKVIRVTAILDIIFSSLMYILKSLREAIDNMEESQLKNVVDNMIVSDIDIIAYIMLQGTTIIPGELLDELRAKMNIVTEAEERIIRKCKTIIRKGSIGNSYYICDFNPKLDMSKACSTTNGFLCNAQAFIERKKKLVTESSNKLVSLVSDNIPVKSPYAVMLLLAMIKALRRNKITHDNTPILKSAKIVD